MYLIVKLLAILGWAVFSGAGQTPATYAEETRPCTQIIWTLSESGWLAYIPREMSFLSDGDFGETLSPSRTFWSWCPR